MANESSPSDRSVPVPSRNPASQYPLGMPAQHGLGQPWPTDARGRADDEDVIDLAQLWRTVARHKWLLLSMALLGLLAAVMLSFASTPLYQATSTLQVDKRAASVLKFGRELDSEVDLDERTGMGTQLELLKSRALAERVIDELGLDRLLAAKAPAQPKEDTSVTTSSETSGNQTKGILDRLLARVHDSWNKLRQPAATSDQQLSRAEVLAIFRNTVRIEQVRNSRIFKVAVDNPDPQLAARIANTTAEGFIALNLERRMEASAYAKSFLDEQLGQAKVKLEESERQMNRYARENRILTLDERTDVVNQTFTEFSTALSNAEQERIRFESEYRAIQSAPDTARQVLENSTIQAYKAQRIQLETEYQQNIKVFKEDFPRMVQLRARITELDQKIRDEVNSILRSVNNQLTAAKRQEAMIKQRVADTRREIVRGQDVRVDYNLLKREADTNRLLYDGLLQQLKEVTVAGGVETNNVQIVDRAVAPLFPYKPKIPLNAVIGLLAGLALGMLLVLLMESMDDSIKSPDEVEEAFMLPLLGVIPNVRKKGGLPSLALLAHLDPRSSLAEAYRSTRTALQFSTPDGAPRRLVVTSTIKNEGKTTTALALAINFAQLGSRVVLVDADLRSPSIHTCLGRENSDGLSNFLAGRAPDGVLVQDTDIPGLSVITAGPTPPNPVDLLMGLRFDNLLDQLHDEGYEYIIIEAPPVLGLADAIVLGNQVGSVLYVAQAGHTRKSYIRSALRRLRSAGVEPCGLVLTRASKESSAYGADADYYGYGAKPIRGEREQLAMTHVEPALRPG